MIAAFDNTFLTLLLNPKAKPRPNPETGKPATHHRERIETLIDVLSDSKSKIIIPMPAFAEAMTFADKQQEYLDVLKSYSCIELASFDERAAIELAIINKQAIAAGDIKSGVAVTRQEAKLDNQIVAIAKVAGATIFYTDDDAQAKFAQLARLEVRHTWDLPLSGKRAQFEMFGGGKNG